MAASIDDIDVNLHFIQQFVAEATNGLKTSEITSRAQMVHSEIRVPLKPHQDAKTGTREAAIRNQWNCPKNKSTLFNNEDNEDRIKNAKILPYLVSTVIEVLDEIDTALLSKPTGTASRCAVIKTSTRQVFWMLNHSAQAILLAFIRILTILSKNCQSSKMIHDQDTIPEKTILILGALTNKFKRFFIILQLIEAIVLPMTQEEKFMKLGVQPPKGVLLYGPPGTGKTLLARACAAQTKAFIGEGAKIVRDAFALAKEKAPTIIFIDELDAIGTKRFDSDKTGDREVQRTMLELLNQLDGFTPNNKIKVCGPYNRLLLPQTELIFLTQLSCAQGVLI
ncbi:26S protease regulatory subunit 6A [Thelohanellus kitauei]|uniref:26S protease regulatory subunit 6A n=1 Tax=Thelohanellus kitauei TaxID=669202 RepID=A0A0C2J1P9_THEKT|nr:26S protease regulatory subunit 6A [Thelohanellus kitauei]